MLNECICCPCTMQQFQMGNGAFHRKEEEQQLYIVFMIWYRDASTLTRHNSGLIHQSKQYQIYLILISDTCRNAASYILGFCTIPYFVCLSSLNKRVWILVKERYQTDKNLI
jgi:hypothetical protein